jgi:hypothetical protein
MEASSRENKEIERSNNNDARKISKEDLRRSIQSIQIKLNFWEVGCFHTI